MAMQGNLSKFVCNFKTLLNLNRNVLNQQHAYIKQSTREKMQTIPDKPKKPLTAYFRFMQQQRVQILKQHPDMKTTAVTQQCATDWKNVNEAIKERYMTEYKKDMEQYTKLIGEYDAKLTDEQKETLRVFSDEKKRGKEKRKLRKEIKAADKPKRPIGPYMQYLIDVSKQRGMKMNEALRQVKGEWHSLPQSEKDIYNKRFEADKQRYEKAMATWEAKMMSTGQSHLVRTATLDKANKIPTPFADKMKSSSKK